MSKRASIGNLLLRLLAFAAFMMVLVGALGFGVGIPELIIWLAVALVGVLAIIGRHRRAKAAAPA